MSNFLKLLQKHQAEIDRMIEAQGHGSPLTYSMMQSMGMLKPFAVRLPIPLIAVLDEVANHGLWRSKQEMVYDMIQSAYLDFYESSSDETKAKLKKVQEEALGKWTDKERGIVSRSSTHAGVKPSKPKKSGKTK